jgi:hypothetical protein
MNRNQQIRESLELLAPPPLERAECQHDIGLALDRVEHGSAATRSFRVAVSKKGKAEVTRYFAALRRLRNAYNSLDPAIKRWFSLAETGYVAGKATVIDREIVKAEAFLNRPSPPPRRDASRNKAAVEMAYDLLELWGHKAAVSRSGKWAKLAQILSSNRTVDVLDHLGAFKRSFSSNGGGVKRARLMRIRRRHPGIESPR